MRLRKCEAKLRCCAGRRRHREKSRQRILGVHTRLGDFFWLLFEYREALERFARRSRTAEKVRMEIDGRKVTWQGRSAWAWCSFSWAGLTRSERSNRFCETFFSILTLFRWGLWDFCAGRWRAISRKNVPCQWLGVTQ